jgi:hypothetical protein
MRIRAAALVATVALATVAAAPARAATVELRVEAARAAAPLFAGPVATEAHRVDGGDGSGPHACDGPAGAAASPTATGALDDAMRAAGIPWRGNWDPNFDDFFIERIGAFASRAPDEYWSLTVDGAYAPGGCLATLADGDEVRFYYGPAFGEAPAAPPAGESGGGTGGGGAGAEAAPAGNVAPVAGPTEHVRAGRLAKRAARYLHGHREAAGDPWSRLALAVRRRASPGAAAAKLLGRRLRHQRADGSLAEDVDFTALAVLAYEATAPRRAARAAAWLVRVQGAGGGFGFRPRAAADVDTTGLAAWALARQGRRQAARRAGLFVLAAQAVDGGFPAAPGGEANAQSTGLALLALRSARLGIDRPSASGATPLEYLGALGRGDGSIEYASGSAPTPVWTTAQVLLGLLPRGKLLRKEPAARHRQSASRHRRFRRIDG